MAKSADTKETVFPPHTPILLQWVTCGKDTPDLLPFPAGGAMGQDVDYLERLHHFCQMGQKQEPHTPILLALWPTDWRDPDGKEGLITPEQYQAFKALQEKPGFENLCVFDAREVCDKVLTDPDCSSEEKLFVGAYKKMTANRVEKLGRGEIKYETEKPMGFEGWQSVIVNIVDNARFFHLHYMDVVLDVCSQELAPDSDKAKMLEEAKKTPGARYLDFDCEMAHGVFPTIVVCKENQGLVMPLSPFIANPEFGLSTF